MARGQERDITGGKIDPYVQEALGRGRNAAENRLTTAMQNAAAGQRQQSANQAAAVQQGVQMGANAYQEAAQRRQEDKRAAEAEKIRREQNEFDRTMQESQQEFAAKENRIRIAHEEAMQKEDFERADKLHAEEIAIRRTAMAVEAKRAAANDNFMHSMLLGNQQKETAMQKAITVDQQAAEQGERDVTVYDKLKTRVYDNTRVSLKNLKIEEQKGVKYTRGMYEFGLHPEVITTGKDYTAPSKILQDSISSNGSKISIEDLTTSTVSNLKDKIREGKIDAEDIRSASAALDGILPAIDDQLKDVTGQKQTLWKSFKVRVSNMQDNLESLRYNPDKIEGQKNQTVGSIVKMALGVKYPELSYNTRMFNMRNQVGSVNEDFIKGMTQSIEPWQFHLLDIDPETMSKQEVQEREAFNANLTAAREKYQGNGNTVNWGAE